MLEVRRFWKRLILLAGILTVLFTAIPAMAAVSKVTITATDVATTAVKLKWKKIKGIDGYRIYNVTDGTPKLVAGVGKKKTSAKIKNLTTGKTYKFYMTSYKGAEESEPSVTVSLTPAIKGLEQIFNVTVTNSNGKVGLRWYKNFKATGYVLYRENSEGEFVPFARTKGRSYTIKKLTNGEEYHFKVSTYKIIGGKTYYGTPSEMVVGKPQYNEDVESVHKYFYKGKMKTTVKVGGVTFKKGKTVAVMHPRTTKKARIVYKGQTYNVPWSKVKLVDFITNSKAAYSQEVAEAYVNSKGYTSSTGYLVWVNTYVQHIYIFTGAQYNWKMVKKYICSTGHFGEDGEGKMQESVLGIGYLGQKLPVFWFSEYQYAKWATGIPGGFIHSWMYSNTGQLLPNGGIWGSYGKPASHGCIRVHLEHAKWIYDNVPTKTTLVVH